jgi:hypothetical protein
MIKVDSEYSWVLERCKWYVQKGYAVGRPNGRKNPLVRLHRYVWELTHGTVPPMLDHVNGDRLDNRLENLRPATVSLNTRNTRRRRKLDLPPGVRYRPEYKSRPYHVAVCRHGKTHYIGCYATAEAAANKYQEVKEILMEFEALYAAHVPTVKMPSNTPGAPLASLG